jgi:hypothetical protein
MKKIDDLTKEFAIYTEEVSSIFNSHTKNIEKIKELNYIGNFILLIEELEKNRINSVSSSKKHVINHRKMQSNSIESSINEPLSINSPRKMQRNSIESSINEPLNNAIPIESSSNNLTILKQFPENFKYFNKNKIEKIKKFIKVKTKPKYVRNHTKIIPKETLQTINSTRIPIPIEYQGSFKVIYGEGIYTYNIYHDQTTNSTYINIFKDNEKFMHLSLHSDKSFSKPRIHIKYNSNKNSKEEKIECKFEVVNNKITLKPKPKQKINPNIIEFFNNVISEIIKK